MCTTIYMYITFKLVFNRMGTYLTAAVKVMNYIGIKVTIASLQNTRDNHETCSGELYVTYLYMQRMKHMVKYCSLCHTKSTVIHFG